MTSMANNLQQRTMNDDDDTVSLTSTQFSEQEDGAEYVVEQIHSERRMLGPDDEVRPHFLVEWTNFPLDQCTWEPIENLPEELMDQWNEKKRTQDPSVALEFEAKQEAAVKDVMEQTRQRHRRRNAKRRRLGRSPTRFCFRGKYIHDSDDEQDSRAVSSVSVSDAETEARESSSDESIEAEEDDLVDHRAREALLPLAKSTKKAVSKPQAPKSQSAARPPNKIFTLNPYSMTASTKEKKASQQLPKSATHKASKTLPAAAKTDPKRSQGDIPGQRRHRNHELPSSTGYQGSAKRSITTKAQPTRPTSQSSVKGTVSSKDNSTPVSAAPKGVTPVAPVPSMTVAERPAEGLMAKKSTTSATKISKPVLKSKSSAVNVFAGGKLRKKREAPANAEGEMANKKQRMYGTAQIRRKAELASRSKEDKAPDINKLAGSLFIPGVGVDVDSRNTQIARPREAVKVTKVTNTALGNGDTTSARDESSVDRIEPPKSADAVATPVVLQKAATIPGGLPLKSALATAKRISISTGADQSNRTVKTVRWGASDYAPEPSEFAESREARFPGADERYVRSSLDADEENTEANSSAFTGEDSLFVGSPMEIDDDLGLDPEPAPLSLTTSHATSLRPSEQPMKSQTLTKKFILPASQNRSVDMSLTGVPNQASAHEDPEWLPDFVNADRIELGHTVFAETFIVQLRSFQDQHFHVLACGDVTSEDVGSLTTMSGHLRASTSALFVSRQRFNLVIFPTACTEFEALSEFGIDTGNPNGVCLKYFLFGSDQPLYKLIRPSSDDATDPKYQIAAGREYVILFPTILGMQFSQLTKPFHQHQKRHFFLAFPERAMCWVNAIGSWLSQRDQSCKIYTNFTEGSWSAFCEKTKPPEEYGFVIIHEAIVPYIRRFPFMAKLLQDSSSPIFWMFSESLDQDAPPPPANFSPVIPPMFSRVFPFGKAILITPSFMVSRPRETYELWKYLFKVGRISSSNKFVVPADICDYLRDLAIEKAKEQQYLSNTRWKNRNEVEVASLRNAEGLSNYDLEARQKTWIYVSTWLADTPDIHQSNSLLNNVVFVDKCIDPSDEQSLVNWFGWWAEAHCHEHRKFYVVGSDSSIRQPDHYVATPPPRASHHIKIPKYARSVVNDPDQALRDLAQKSGQIIPADTSGGHNGINSDRFRSEPKLISFIDDLAQSTQALGIGKLFRGVISWTDFDMARYFGDNEFQLKTIEQWWKAKQPWLSDPLHVFRTHIGFFYTFSEDYPSEKLPRKSLPPRHGWIAICRPVDAHNTTNQFRHGRTELVILDARLGDELEDRDEIFMSDLTWMQRQLIDYVSRHAPDTDVNAYVDRVWLGGFGLHQQRFCPSQPRCPLDMAVEMLHHVCGDLKFSVPSAAKYLKENGFRPVSTGSSRSSAPKQNQKHEQADDDPDRRLIFHPPRGAGAFMPKSVSKCKNNLFEAARLARLRDKAAVNMTFTYPPTMDWYQHQINEGRQFEHVMVDSWQEIFKACKIPLPVSDQAPRAATYTHPAPPGTTRNGSVSSNHSSPKT